MHGRMVFSLFLSLCMSTVYGKTDNILNMTAYAYAKLHPNKDINDTDPEYGDNFEGDILQENRSGGNSEVNPLNAVTDPKKLWPRGVLPYTITENNYTEEQLKKIENAISFLVNLTKLNGRECIKIVPRSNESNYVRVQNTAGCSSYIGMKATPQILTLGSKCFKKFGTTMHEFLHAFGFNHEQKRSDRDDWVAINWDNIIPEKKHNFNKLTKDENDLLGTPYDYNSIMHYSAYAFAIDKKIPTIIPLELYAEIGQRKNLSKVDIERVQILYGCLKPKHSRFFKRLDPKWIPKQQFGSHYDY